MCFSEMSSLISIVFYLAYLYTEKTLRDKTGEKFKLIEQY